jgi:hypothetical protein
MEHGQSHPSSLALLDAQVLIRFFAKNCDGRDYAMGLTAECCKVTHVAPLRPDAVGRSDGRMSRSVA